MKIFTLITSLCAMVATLLSLAPKASAYPAVNDKVIYSGSHTTSSTQQPLTIQVELVSYDVSKKTYTQRTVSTIDGKSSLDVKEVLAEKMMSPGVIQPILNNCTGHGGTPETVTTSAGFFHACAMSMENEKESGVYWFADVPFGFVKIVTYEKAGERGSTVLTLEQIQQGTEH